jgi:hypothetical protein
VFLWIRDGREDLGRGVATRSALIQSKRYQRICFKFTRLSICLESMSILMPDQMLIWSVISGRFIVILGCGDVSLQTHWYFIEA